MPPSGRADLRNRTHFRKLSLPVYDFCLHSCRELRDGWAPDLGRMQSADERFVEYF